MTYEKRLPLNILLSTIHKSPHLQISKTANEFSVRTVFSMRIKWPKETQS